MLPTLKTTTTSYRSTINNKKLLSLNAYSVINNDLTFDCFDSPLRKPWQNDADSQVCKSKDEILKCFFLAFRKILIVELPLAIHVSSLIMYNLFYQ